MTTELAVVPPRQTEFSRRGPNEGHSTARSRRRARRRRCFAAVYPDYSVAEACVMYLHDISPANVSHDNISEN